MEKSKKKPSDTVYRQIDENLRRVYNEALEEGVPDRFRDLLNRLREQDGTSKAAKDQ